MAGLTVVIDACCCCRKRSCPPDLIEGQQSAKGFKQSTQGLNRNVSGGWCGIGRRGKGSQKPGGGDGSIPTNRCIFQPFSVRNHSCNVPSLHERVVIIAGIQPYHVWVHLAKIKDVFLYLFIGLSIDVLLCQFFR